MSANLLQYSYSLAEIIMMLLYVIAGPKALCKYRLTGTNEGFTLGELILYSLNVQHYMNNCCCIHIYIQQQCRETNPLLNISSMDIEVCNPTSQLLPYFSSEWVTFLIVAVVISFSFVKDCSRILWCMWLFQ